MSKKKNVIMTGNQNLHSHFPLMPHPLFFSSTQESCGSSLCTHGSSHETPIDHLSCVSISHSTSLDHSAHTTFYNQLCQGVPWAHNIPYHRYVPFTLNNIQCNMHLSKFWNQDLGPKRGKMLTLFGNQTQVNHHLKMTIFSSFFIWIVFFNSHFFLLPCTLFFSISLHMHVVTMHLWVISLMHLHHTPFHMST